MDVNKVILLGNVGQDPEIKRWDNGDLQASFTVATSRKWKTKDGSQTEYTEWHRVVVKEKVLAENAQKYVQKGTRVYLEGEAATRKWTDKNGTDRYTTEIIVPRFKGVLNIETRGASNESSGDNSPPDDDIPF